MTTLHDMHTGLRSPIRLALLAGCVLTALIGASVAQAGATPVGAAPKGPVTTITTTRGELFAIALPKAGAATGLVWRVARQYNGKVVDEVSEADVGSSVVIVYKALAAGKTLDRLRADPRRDGEGLQGEGVQRDRLGRLSHARRGAAPVSGRPSSEKGRLMLEIVAYVLITAVSVLSFGFVMVMFVWAARKDGEEDLAVQRRLGIRRKTRIGL